MDIRDDTKNKATSDSIAPKFSDEYKSLHIRPWSRFIARYIDIYVFGILVGIFSLFFYPQLLSDNQFKDGLIVFFLWCIVEPIFLCAFGTTLGKLIFKIKISNTDGKKLKLINVYKRSFGVWIVGLGFGLPIISLFTLIAAQSKLNRTGTTFWDENEFTVTHGEVGYLRKAIAFLIIISVLSLSIYSKSHEYYQKAINSSPLQYAAEIEKENKKLPTMIDADTELYKINFSDNTLNYYFKLINTDANNVNKSYIHDYARNNILKEACNKSNPDPSLTNGYNLLYNYEDKNGVLVTKILIKPSDCNK